MDGLTVAVAALALVVGFAIGRASKSAPSVSIVAAPPDATALERVRPILESGNKILAIKTYREATGAGLAEAKLAVESLERPSG